MDIWFLTDPELLKRERDAVSQLQQSADWLAGVEWSFCGKKLCADVIIKAHSHDYELRLVYPNLFPQVPPTVFPVNASSRWSGHQYGGADGPLCLEWGPDNWHPDVTGAAVLESAYKLLDIENPLGERAADEAAAAVAQIAPSRHALNPGQELRNVFARFYLGSQTLERLNQLAGNAHGTFRFSTLLRSKSYLAVIHDFQVQDESDKWSDPSIPEFFRGSDDDNLRTGAFFKIECSPDTVKAVSNVGELVEFLRTSGYETQVSIDDENKLKIEGIENSSPGCLILDSENRPHFLLFLNNGSTWNFAPINADSNAQAKRTPNNLRELPAKLVGIVGLGSAGSKIAVSLARMGVRHFYLVDYDIFLPENVERHELDWNSLGDHKVDGVQEALLRLGVNFEIEVSRTDITGQESTAVVGTVLDRLGNCDLVIDATADSRVFNLMAAVASVHKKPLVWFEVFAGGIGGMIARSRPELDPDAQTMRAAYLGYCEQNPAPENLRPAATRDYASENADGAVYAASDADVAIIAYHAARLAADTLSSENSSFYPFSMYLIGLAKAWVFEAPFAAIPIATNHLLQKKTETTEEESASVADHREFLISLLSKLNATDSSA